MNDSVLFQVQFRTLGKALCNLSRSLNDLNGGKTSVVMFIGSCRNIFFVTRADAVTESVKYYRLYKSTEVRFISFLSGGFTQEPLKLWTELYSELSPNGGLELLFFLL